MRLGQRWHPDWQVLVLLFAVPCGLANLSFADSHPIFGITKAWKYSTNNLTGSAWTSPAYDDSGWSSGPALLYIESNTAISPRNTPLPTRDGSKPYLVYCFRATFNLTNDPAATSLVFSNLVDDGAVFYLNGAEIQRLRMPTSTISYGTGATSTPPGGDATAYDVFTITPTNLVSGNNVLAVEVHQTDSTSSDIVFGSAVYWAQPRGPYLQLGTPTSMTIRWRSGLATDSQVIYGTDPAALNLTNTLSNLTTEHQVKLAGLAPSTRYFYSVGTTTNVFSAAGTNQFFITSPPAGTPKVSRIWVIGDAGTAGRGGAADISNQTAVRNAYYQLTGTNQTDLWLQLGDNAYDNGTDAQYQAAVFDMYSSLLRQSVTWPTLGNHDTDQAIAYTTNYPYFAIFTLPGAGEAGGVPSGTPHYYSFDYANIHFVCLDSMTADRSPSGAMGTWLEADLQANTNQWIIAFWHHPPYTKGSHDSDTETPLVQMRQNMLPILEAYGVDLVVCGHSHSYERSYLLNGHYGLSTNLTSSMILDSGKGREEETGAYVKPRSYDIPNRGAVYAVAGSSGQTSGGALNHPAMCISTNVLGSMLLTISTNRLDAVFLRETGATNDHFTIIKANFPPVASNLNFTVNANVATSLALAGYDVNRDPLQFTTTGLPAYGLLAGPNATNGTFSYTPAWGFSATDTFSFVVQDGTTNSIPATVTIMVQVPADTNYNGLPDAWEVQYDVTAPDADDDQDGMTNLQEYWAGTNPQDAGTWLRITNYGGNSVSGFTLNWPSVGGVRYRVLFSDGSALGGFDGNFTSLVRPVGTEMDSSPPGTASTMTFVDDFSLTGAPPNPARYYRIQIVH
jgi:hypothetical protein